MSDRTNDLTDDAITQFLRTRSADPDLGLLDDIMRTVGATPQDRPWLGLRPIRLPSRTMLIVAIALLVTTMGAVAVGSRFLQPVLTGSPFLGTWVTTDPDGSTLTMVIRASEGEEVEIEAYDGIASVCSGASSTMTGTGRLDGSTQLVIPSPFYACDDGSEPEAMSGRPLEEQLRNLTFVHDPETDALTDNFGGLWLREGAENPSPEPNTSGPPLTAAQEATVGRLVDAANAAAAGTTADQARLLDVFTEDAMIGPIDGRDGSPVTEPGLVEAWILHLRTWGFEGDLQECLTDAADRFCVVRARWHTVLAEADEYWNVDFVGDRIQSLTIDAANGGRHGDPVLPLSLAELDGWEDWLQETDPATAARLTRYKDTSRLFPAVPRYDPALAYEITASIQLYLAQRPPGDEIRVTPDLVEFGDGLVGLISNMDRADGRTYVIGGRYETETDLFFPPDEAVLAAFDDIGTELWRIDLDDSPRRVVGVAGDVWVSHETGALSRFDASDGRFIDRVTVGDTWSLFAPFGSVWVRTLDVEVGSGQLIRVHPDMSTTTIELPASIIANLDDVPSLDPTAGPGGIWVPLGGAGVAVVDVESGQVTVIHVDDIGHEV